MTKGLAAIKVTLEAEGIEFTSNAGVLGVLLHPRRASEAIVAAPASAHIDRPTELERAAARPSLVSKEWR